MVTTTNSFQRKIIATFMVISILPLLIATIFAYYNYKAHWQAHGLERVNEANKQAAYKANVLINQYKKDVINIAHSHFVQTLTHHLPDSATLPIYKENLNHTLRHHTVLQHFYRNGSVRRLADSAIVFRGDSMAVDNISRCDTVFTNNMFCFSPIYKDTCNRQLLFNITYTYADSANERLQFNVTINADSILSQISDSTARLLIDNNFRPHLCTDSMAMDELNGHISILRSKTITTQTQSAITTTSDRQIAGISYCRLAAGEWIMLSQNTIYARQSYGYQLLIFLGVLILVSIVVVYAVVKVLTRRFMERVENISLTAKQIAEGNTEVNFAWPAKNEFSEMTDYINKVVEKLRMTQQRDAAVRAITNSVMTVQNISEFISITTQQLEKTCQNPDVIIMEKQINDSYLISAYNNTTAFANQKSRSWDVHNFLENPANSQLTIVHDISTGGHLFDLLSVLPYPVAKVALLPIVIDTVVELLIIVPQNNTFRQEHIEYMELVLPNLTTAFSRLVKNIEAQKSVAQQTIINELLKKRTIELQNEKKNVELSSKALKTQNEILYLQQQQVREANRLKTEFLSNMSHELRTPLNSIMALSRVLLLQTDDQLNEENQGYLQIIEKNGKNLLSLINDILDLSKIEAGKMKTEVSEFDIIDLVRSIGERLQPLAMEKKITITINAHAKKQTIASDKKKVQQIVQNIIGNAIKFTLQGSVNVNISETQEQVLIAVADTGIGIPTDEIPFIFDEFRQVDGSSTRNFEGTGLGLSIVRNNAQLIGAHIDVSSKPKEGSVFRVYIPIEYKQQAPNDKHSNTSADNTLTDPVLLLSDNEKILQRATEILTRDGLTTLQTNSAEYAFDFAQKQKRPAVVTLVTQEAFIKTDWHLYAGLASPNIYNLITITDPTYQKCAFLGEIIVCENPTKINTLIKKIKLRDNLSTAQIIILSTTENVCPKMQQISTGNTLKTITTENLKQILQQIFNFHPDIILVDSNNCPAEILTLIKAVRIADLDITPIVFCDVTAENADRLFTNFKQHPLDFDTTMITLADVMQQVASVIRRYCAKYQVSDKQVLLVKAKETTTSEVEYLFATASIGMQIATPIVLSKILAVSTFNIIVVEHDITPNIVHHILEFINLSAVDLRSVNIVYMTKEETPADDLAKLTAKNVTIIHNNDFSKVRQLIYSTQHIAAKQQDTLTADSTPDSELDKNDTKKILVIEDNNDNLMTIEAILKKRYQLAVARTGTEGLQAAHTDSPDLIILDLKLPDMEGATILKTLKTSDSHKQIPIIILSGISDANTITEMKNEGCADYLTKPIDPLVLLSAIKMQL